MNSDKVRGMLFGGAIGDALGMPVETWTPAKILEYYPSGIQKFEAPTNHKWFDPEKTPAGSITDDTQLTIATLNGLISGEESDHDYKEGFPPYMDAIAAHHCTAMLDSTAGWGKSTKEAVRRMQNGVSWEIAGQTTEQHRGTGNGVPMKISPLAAWFASPRAKLFIQEQPGFFPFNQWCVIYSAMTHWTQISAYAGVIHANAMYYCLSLNPQTFNVKLFCDLVANTIWECEGLYDQDGYTLLTLEKTEGDLRGAMKQLFELHSKLPSMTQEEISEAIGPGSCYVLESLPFSYAYFLRKPTDFSGLIEVVNAGGDTDTNAKIVGEMLGALHGYEELRAAMPWAVEGLRNREQLDTLATQFCDTFDIE
jgi:ADP-ribosylglycohydrolase